MVTRAGNGCRPRRVVRTVAAGAAVLLSACHDRVSAEVPPTTVGVTTGKLLLWGGERSLANLLGGSTMNTRAPDGHWIPAPPEMLNERGYPLPDSDHEGIMPIAAPPRTGLVRIQCTWQGRARPVAEGVNLRPLSQNANRLVFEWRLGVPGTNGWIRIPAHGGELSDLDCREEGMDRTLTFAPEFVASLAPFKVLRFLDWQMINENGGGVWAKRTLPADATQTRPDGMAVELLVDLLNQTNADGWFIMPWKADDDYVERYARYVHDHLHPGGVAYVEFANEVWNAGFQPAYDARAEGVAEKLSDNPFEAQMRRYAEKAAHALAIWTRVFADRPKGLVRVVSTQNAISDTARIVLGFRDTAHWVDALATAPYFGWGLMTDGQVRTPDDAFARVDGEIDEAMRLARENKAVAAQYGKRYIAYEAGQHIVTPDLALEAAIQRDPRMEAAYLRYMRAWSAEIGDTLMLYQLTGGVTQWGSWGLVEASGQADADAPKYRAARAFTGR